MLAYELILFCKISMYRGSIRYQERSQDFTVPLFSFFCPCLVISPTTYAQLLIVGPNDHFI